MKDSLAQMKSHTGSKLACVAKDYSIITIIWWYRENSVSVWSTKFELIYPIVERPGRIKENGEGDDKWNFSGILLPIFLYAIANVLPFVFSKEIHQNCYLDKFYWRIKVLYVHYQHSLKILSKVSLPLFKKLRFPALMWAPRSLSQQSILNMSLRTKQFLPILQLKNVKPCLPETYIMIVTRKKTKIELKQIVNEEDNHLHLKMLLIIQKWSVSIEVIPDHHMQECACIPPYNLSMQWTIYSCRLHWNISQINSAHQVIAFI